MDFNENSPNGTSWGSWASIKIWFYDSFLTEVGALESFVGGIKETGMFVRVCGKNMVQRHREM